jgi:glutamine amidotransferase
VFLSEKLSSSSLVALDVAFEQPEYMCQLLGMNCNVPTDICFSFTGFCARGGHTDDHQDGWGIAFFEGPGCRLFIDEKPAARSPIAEMVKQYPIRSKHVIAHIRKATQGEIALHNCHPFRRELWGRYWVFAHNGDLKDLSVPLTGRFKPVGSTDSERAFCQILEQLQVQFSAGRPTTAKLYTALQEITAQITPHGTFNYLLSDGHHLFAHCTTQLHYIVRQAPFAQAHLADQDVTVDFQELTTPQDHVAVIATLPLTDNEVWTAMTPHQLLLFQDGQPTTPQDD